MRRGKIFLTHFEARDIKNMAIDTKHDDLQSLRIDRSAGPAMARDLPGPAATSSSALRWLCSRLGTLAYRLFVADAPEVEVLAPPSKAARVGGTVLTATGYIVPHHKINVNSKVTGRVKWIGVEKGDKVKEGQVLVRLEDEEFRAQYDQARGAAESARAYLAGIAKWFASRRNCASGTQS